MRPGRRTTFATTAICLIGGVVTAILILTGRGTPSTAVLLTGAAIGFVGGVVSLWVTRGQR